ncbi:MAG: hypothetical protein K9G33_11965 [Sneathiella sp.]|nr:hypothetical protein [Sneathiella sp.]
MILKLLSIAFICLFVTRLLFARKFKELGKVADRTLNLFLIALAIYLGLQALVVYGLS